MRLADAFARLGRGSLTFVGDGPLRPALEARDRVVLVGREPHDAVPGWLAAADVVCGPSLIEPFGQALLEAMASRRSVVATRIGGPPEFVTPEAGVLVDPLDVPALARALELAAAAAEAERGGPGGRRRARRQPAGSPGGGDSRASRSRSASLISTSGRTPSSRPCSTRHRERLLVALADLLDRDALLEPVVAGQEQVVDLLARLSLVHDRNLPRGFAKYSVPRARWTPRPRPVRR